HVATEHHRLKIEATIVGQHARDPCEQTVIDLLLAPRAILLWRTEVLEGTQTRHRVERAEALAAHLPRVEEVNIEAVTPAGHRLRRGQGDADPGATPTANEDQQRTPPTA